MEKLSCDCSRIVTPNVLPTQRRSGDRNPEEQIRLFCAPHSLDICESTYLHALYRTKCHFNKIFGTYRPFYLTDRLGDLRKNTSPGPFFKKMGFSTKTEVLDSPKGLEQIKLTFARLKRLPHPDVVHYPSQVTVVDAVEDIRTKEIKRRVAWVYPINILALENMFAAPFLDALPETWVPSPETHHKEFCGYMSKSMDYSKFDTSINARFIKDAFAILKEHLDFSYYQGGAFKANPEHLNNIWNFLVRYFIYTPFKTSENENIRRKHHGVPSGSQFTNLIDTIVSYLTTCYIHLKQDCFCKINTYGDDVHCSNCRCNNDALKLHALRIGLKLKVELPNEHGCLTYCKAECHKGIPFHSGQWFSNIMNKAGYYLKEVIECIMHYSPTLKQYKQLLSKWKSLRYSNWLHSRFKNWRDKFLEFRAHTKYRVTNL